ncbi:MAG: hypothetical protein CMQ43_11015 [Gammaproteobacteria bacterium]|nr:hypothetical protein [Gammaproteobacteria bacterium]
MALGTVMALVFVSTGYEYVRRIAEEREIDRLVSENDMLRLQVETRLRSVLNDLQVIREYPPILGLARSVSSGGVDPEDGSTTEAWRQRLGVIFRAMLDARPSYTQIRYVGVAERGRELVRVERTSAGSVHVTQEDRLQSKSQRDYFRVGVGLPAGAMAFSQVTPNIEFGEVVADDPPTIRAVTPIRGADGEVFGVLVINADFVKLVAGISQFERRKYVTHFIDPASNRIRTDTDGSIEFHWASEGSDELRGWVSRITSGGVPANQFSGEYQGRTYLTHASELQLDGVYNAAGFHLVSVADEATLFADVLVLQQRMIAIALAVVLFGGLVGALFGRRLVVPLNALAESMEKYGSSESLNLPTRDRTEIGGVARRFEALTRRLREIESAERAVRVQLESVVNGAVDGLITIDTEGSVLSFNPACERLFGVAAGDVLGRNVSMLMPETVAAHHDGYVADHMRTGRERMIGMRRQLQARRRDGTEFPIELSVSRIELPDRIIFSGIVRDVSERVTALALLEDTIDQLEHTNVALSEANERLDQANGDVRSLAYIISHDLKAPLINLLSFSGELRELMDELQSLTGNDTPEARDRAQQIMGETVPLVLGFVEESAARMDIKLNLILQLSKLGRYEFRPEPVDLASVFEGAVADAAAPEDRASVTVEVDPTPFNVDRQAVTIIAANLVSNALKYRSDDRPLSVIITGTREDGRMHLCVEDHGRGIAPDDLTDVFNLFRRVGRQDTKGDGIGLSYCSMLVKRLNGRIWCESVLGRGSRFHVVLPETAVAERSEAA